MSETTAVKTDNKAGKSLNIRKVALVGMLSAVAAVLMYFEFPLPFIAPPFYELDFSEVPVLIGTFALGPVSGMVIELVKILVKLIIKGTSTAFVGEVANFAVGCALVLPAGIIYHFKRTRKGAVLGMIAGTLTMTLAGMLLNAFVLLPMYAAAFGGMEAIVAAGTAVNGSVDSVFGFVALCVAPFNLIKGLATSVLTFFLYKRISSLVKR